MSKQIMGSLVFIVITLSSNSYAGYNLVTADGKHLWCDPECVEVIQNKGNDNRSDDENLRKTSSDEQDTVPQTTDDES